MGYTFLDDVSIADVAFSAESSDLDGLLSSCALALSNTMVKNLDSIRETVTRRFAVHAKELDLLVVEFLNKLVFYKDSQSLIFRGFKVVVKRGGFGWSADCLASGEKIDPKRHEMVVDVKSATMHLLEVKKQRKGWSARVVLDV